MAYLVVPFLIIYIWMDVSTKGPQVAASRIKTENAPIAATQGIKIKVTSTPLPEYKEIKKGEYYDEPTLSHDEKVQNTKLAKGVTSTFVLSGTEYAVTVTVLAETHTKTSVPLPLGIIATKTSTAGSKNTIITVIKEVTRIIYPTQAPTIKPTNTPTITKKPELIILKTFTPSSTSTLMPTPTKFIRPVDWKLLYLPFISK